MPERDPAEVAAKIHKLLGLVDPASGSTPAEAEVALHRALDLAHRYKIDGPDTFQRVTTVTRPDGSVQVAIQLTGLGPEKLSAWRASLKPESTPAPSGPALAITPTYDDQDEACQKILDAFRRGDQIITLSGLAGTGKTRLLSRIRSLIWDSLGLDSVFATPTGASAAVLEEASGVETRTIHSRLYTERETDPTTGQVRFKLPESPVGPGCALFIDEGSMIGVPIIKDIKKCLPPGCSVLIAGDPGQLRPVKAEPGVDLERPTAMLTTIHRQAAGSAIVSAAHAVRKGDHPCLCPEGDDYTVIAPKRPSDVGAVSLSDIVDWFAAVREENPDEPRFAVLLTHTNEMVRKVNLMLRRKLGFEAKDPHLCAGELIIVRANNRPVYNGEAYVVENVFEHPTKPGMLRVKLKGVSDYYTVVIDLIGASPEEFHLWVNRNTYDWREATEYLHIQYGNCTTVYASQGSQYPMVGIILDSAYDRMRLQKPDDAKRLAYTAITRARRHCVVFSMVYVSPNTDRMLTDRSKGGSAPAWLRKAVQHQTERRASPPQKTSDPIDFESLLDE